ncbi:MAG: cobyric acid synthase [Alistipes sp.]|nr:cobyric acid synthase [Alistipes sp.]
MAKVIMIQGTMSGAGKSLITAGLCRVFAQDGYKTAPFKSQNMALNSYITEDGMEIGRAQAVQAQACGIKPEVFMNPVLLKPTTDMGSQVIVNGSSIGNMTAREYFAFKKSLVPQIMEAYQKLDNRYDIIVVEGAGSPAEINLKSEDIVNMGLAKMIDAPVLLVGDIDCGGVFAQLYGTVALLSEEERARVKGLVINKFRGDESILTPGVAMLEEKCRISVLGVLPYTRVDIEEEDSFSSRFSGTRGGEIKVGVIRFPRLSNYTDFAPLEACEDVELTYIENARQLARGDFDLVILPGSKNTAADLTWFRENAMEDVLLKIREKGTVIMGICGGFQMLGMTIRDPLQVEGASYMEGCGLLPVETTFSEKKHTTQSRGRIFDGSGEICGYEIHMGECSYGKGAKPFIIKDDGTYDGCIRENVFGTYFHGIFENGEFTDALLEKLAQKKGITLGNRRGDYGAYREKQFDILADMIRNHMNMETVYHILKIR